MSLKDKIKAEQEKSKAKQPRKRPSQLKAIGFEPDKMVENYFNTKLGNLFYYDQSEREDRIGLHASSLVASNEDFCYRQQVLSLFFRQTQGDIPPMLKRIFEQGHAIHEKWQNLFTMGGIARGIEYRCYSEEYDLLLTPDIIFEMIDGPYIGRYFVGEIKSMSEKQYWPARHHLSASKQSQIYMHFTGIPETIVIAECKNAKADFKTFHVPYKPELVRPYLERLVRIRKMKNLFIKSKELPPKLLKCKHDKCTRAKQCNMRDACYNIGIGREWLPADKIEYPAWHDPKKKKGSRRKK